MSFSSPLLRLLSVIAIVWSLTLSGAQAADTPAAADAPAAAEKKPIPYPLDHCIVSGDPLKNDTMGKPITTVYKGQEIIFCCKDCVSDFNKDPDGYVTKMHAAEAKKNAATSPASGAPGSGN